VCAADVQTVCDSQVLVFAVFINTSGRKAVFKAVTLFLHLPLL